MKNILLDDLNEVAVLINICKNKSIKFSTYPKWFSKGIMYY